MNSFFYGMNIYVAIIMLAIGIGLFFLLRELYCWYYKINEMLVRLEKLEQSVNEQGNAMNDKLADLCKNGISIKEKHINIIVPEEVN